MASGIPIIATNSGGITEACKECAIIINKNNATNEIQSSIIKLYSNILLRQELSNKSLNQSITYDNNQYAKNLLLTLNP